MPNWVCVSLAQGWAGTCHLGGTDLASVEWTAVLTRCLCPVFLVQVECVNVGRDDELKLVGQPHSETGIAG